MRQQLQEAAVNTRPPSQEPARSRETAAHSGQEKPAAAAPPESGEPDEVLAGLAQSVSQAVVSAVSRLEHRRSEEKRSLEQTVQDQSQRLDSALERIAQMQQRIEEATRLVEEQKAQAQTASDTFTRLTSDIAEFQTRDTTRERVLDELRRETLDLSVSVSDRQDQTSGRLDLQQTDIASLKADIATLKPGVEQATQRLDRQSQVIRAVLEAEKRREEALGRLSDAATSLKESTLRYPEGLSEELL